MCLDWESHGLLYLCLSRLWRKRGVPLGCFLTLTSVHTSCHGFHACHFSWSVRFLHLHLLPVCCWRTHVMSIMGGASCFVPGFGPLSAFFCSAEPSSSCHGLSFVNMPTWSWIVSIVAWFVGLCLCFLVAFFARHLNLGLFPYSYHILLACEFCASMWYVCAHC